MYHSTKYLTSIKFKASVEVFHTTNINFFNSKKCKGCGLTIVNGTKNVITNISEGGVFFNGNVKKHKKTIIAK